MKIVLLSGPTAVGKSTVADILVNNHNFRKVVTSDQLKAIAAERGVAATKSVLQEIGDDLDRRTDFSWVVDSVFQIALDESPRVSRWLLDSVRKQRQVDIFRQRHGGSVFHAHLCAPDEILEHRYLARAQRLGVSESPYEDVIAHPNEVAARALCGLADRVFDTTRDSNEHIVRAILASCHPGGC